MKPAKFIELFWKYVRKKFTGRIVIELNEGGVRDAYESLETKTPLTDGLMNGTESSQWRPIKRKGGC